MSRASPSVLTGKRKRAIDDHDIKHNAAIAPAKLDVNTNIQLITGSYGRTLHGIVISIPHETLASTGNLSPVAFSDTFLFHAHASSIRCLALSPASNATGHNSPKRILATGGTDERINLYSISTTAPPRPRKSLKFSTVSPSLEQTSRNREIGTLLHHSSTVSNLFFPSRAKLLSASYDNTIAITRVRDWTVLSTVRAPIPKTSGRPSGDTAAPGEVPAGINAVAVHPSAKLCISVGQGERCMRLWNLVTGKKAGILTFDKHTLSFLGEARWRGGEGRSVVWSSDGEEFAVGFEKGAIIYGQDCQVKGIAKLPGSKICQMKYIPQNVSPSSLSPLSEEAYQAKRRLAVSTEDGRIVIFESSASNAGKTNRDRPSHDHLLEIVGQLGSPTKGNRTKDFEVIPVSEYSSLLIFTGSSNGSISVWALNASELGNRSTSDGNGQFHDDNDDDDDKAVSADNQRIIEKENNSIQSMGRLLGTFQTNERITCLSAFVMDEDDPTSTEEVNGAAEEWSGFEDSDQEDDSEQSNDSD